MLTKNYQLEIKDNKLIFKTSSFKAEKTSVLHPGVYTKEFSSMLFASAACVASYMMTDIISGRSPVVRYALLIIIFVASFLGANRYIFKERYLEVVFDKTDKTASITQSRLLAKKIEKIPLANIKSVELGSRAFVPENVEGILFVQKISAQHGNAIPDLSEIEEYITLSLKLKDGSERMLYAARLDGGKIDCTPEMPVREIRNFLEHAA